MLAGMVHAQVSAPEDFRVELTASAWRTGIEGTLRSNGVPLAVQLRDDLNLDKTWTFFGKLVLKPHRRHRFIVEGAPYRFSGRNTLIRSITFGGQTFSFQETVESEATLTYLFGGYQFDLISNERGHMGLGAGGAYLDATGTLNGVTSGLSGTRTQKAGRPLATAGFRLFLIPESRLLNLNGEAKGMTVGRFGYYFQTGMHVGVGIRWITLQAGYQYLNADVHESNGPIPAGIAPVIRGPIFSIQFRDR